MWKGFYKQLLTILKFSFYIAKDWHMRKGFLIYNNNFVRDLFLLVLNKIWSYYGMLSNTDQVFAASYCLDEFEGNGNTVLDITPNKTKRLNNIPKIWSNIYNHGDWRPAFAIIELLLLEIQLIDMGHESNRLKPVKYQTASIQKSPWAIMPKKTWRFWT